MAYSVIKTWIPGEILTASDLNAGFSNDIAACNDLDSRVTVEVTAREVLEAEHDVLAANVWDGANTCIAANKVKTLSILNDAVTSAKILAGNVTTSKLPDGVLTADATGRAKMADLFITNAKVNDVASGKITGTITPSDDTVTPAKLSHGMGYFGLPTGVNFFSGTDGWANTWDMRVYIPIGATELQLSASLSQSRGGINIYARIAIGVANGALVTQSIGGVGWVNSTTSFGVSGYAGTWQTITIQFLGYSTTPVDTIQGFMVVWF